MLDYERVTEEIIQILNEIDRMRARVVKIGDAILMEGRCDKRPVNKNKGLNYIDRDLMRR